MGKIFTALAAAITLTCAAAHAHERARKPRYRVEEVRPPASMLAPCLDVLTPQ